MDLERSVLLGGMVIAAGSTIMGTSIFRHDVLGVSAGVTLLPLGYSVMAQNGWPNFGSASRVSLYAAGILAGSLLIGLGLVAGARATETLSSGGMIFSGVAVIAGYFLSHESYIRGFMK